MNNPDDFTVDVEEMREWIIAHREAKGYSWAALARTSSIPSGTLSPFASRIYAGNEQNVAKKIYRYRQLVESQTARFVGVPVEPDFIQTPTAMRIRGLLIMAQRGRITAGATGPGTGKTITMREYADSVANVWVATMKPTTKTLAAMIAEVLRAVGGTPARGWVRQMSSQVVDAVAGRGGLLVIDEANHLEWEAFEELRAWHDASGVGICLLGNEELMARIRGGSRRHAFARLNSRIAMSHIQDLPLEDDIAVFLDAWGIVDAAQRRMLTTIGLTPGAGGLREIKQIIEQASMFAIDEERAVSLDDLKFALSTRATKHIRVAA